MTDNCCTTSEICTSRSTSRLTLRSPAKAIRSKSNSKDNVEIARVSFARDILRFLKGSHMSKSHESLRLPQNLNIHIYPLRSPAPASTRRLWTSEVSLVPATKK